MNLLPDSYPTIYSSKYRRWVDEGFYETDSSTNLDNYHRTLAFDFDDEFLVVFITERDILGIEDTNLTYNIYYIELGSIGNDVFMSNFRYITSSNTPPNFLGNGNFPAQEIMKEKDVREYQQYQRFYVGVQNFMSDVKECVMNINDNLWQIDDDYIPF